MIQVAVLEDESVHADSLSRCLARYGEEHGEEFHVSLFANAVVFLENYRPVYDIVFMDIKMPHMDGMEAAERLRKLDPDVVLVFVTNLMQFAVQGYKVNALDFIVKPVKYYSFALTLERCMEQLRKGRKKELVISSGGKFNRVKTDDIFYIEIFRHHLVFHTANGEVEGYGSLTALEKELEGEPFARCNNCYLVNLKQVSSVEGMSVKVGGDELHMSRSRKKAFTDALNAYYGKE